MTLFPAANQIEVEVQAQQFLAEGKYSEATRLYEQAIANEPDVIFYYWQLGLAYLLQGCEEEAQVTWMLAMAEAQPEEAQRWSHELAQILEAEAQRQLNTKNTRNSWLIRQHIREINPALTSNLFHLIELSIELDEFYPEQLLKWKAAEIMS